MTYDGYFASALHPLGARNYDSKNSLENMSRYALRETTRQLGKREDGQKTVIMIASEHGDPYPLLIAANLVADLKGQRHRPVFTTDLPENSGNWLAKKQFRLIAPEVSRSDSSGQLTLQMMLADHDPKNGFLAKQKLLQLLMREEIPTGFVGAPVDIDDGKPLDSIDFAKTNAAMVDRTTQFADARDADIVVQLVAADRVYGNASHRYGYTDSLNALYCKAGWNTMAVSLPQQSADVGLTDKLKQVWDKMVGTLSDNSSAPQVQQDVLETLGARAANIPTSAFGQARGHFVITGVPDDRRFHADVADDYRGLGGEHELVTHLAAGHLSPDWPRPGKADVAETLRNCGFPVKPPTNSKGVPSQWSSPGASR